MAPDPVDPHPEAPDPVAPDPLASWKRFLPFLPSLLLGAVGGVWVALSPPRFTRDPSLPLVLVSAAALALLLLGAAWLLERRLPSFRHASRLLERALARLRLSPLAALLLAASTAAGEELFFRGGLMQFAGLWGQALLFGALHPVDRRGWSYTLFTFVAGLLFGYAVLVTGSLWTAVLAHFAVNLHGLLSGRRRRAGPQRRLG